MSNIWFRQRNKILAVAFLSVAIFLFGHTSAAQAETCTWTAASSTNMSSSTNWSGCTLDATDDLLFNGNVTNTNATWDSDLTQIASVTVSSTYTGVVHIGAAAATTTGDFIQSAGTVSSTGTGLFKIGGNLTVTSGTFKGNTSGNVEMYGTSQTLSGGGTLILYDLTINGSISLGAGVTVTTTNVLTINAGKSLAGGGGSTRNMIFTKDSGSPFVINGTFDSTSVEVTYSGASSANIAATTYNIVTINTTGTLAGNVTTTNSFTINSGKSLDAASYNMVFAAADTSFAINGTFIPSTSTVTYAANSNGSGANISSATYYNLVVNATNTLAGNVTTTNVLTINSGKTLNAATYNITLTRATGTPFVINGTFTAVSSTVTYSGATSANVANATYYNLTINTAGTLIDGLTVTNNLTINSNKSLDGGGVQINLRKDSGSPFVVSGTFTPNSAVVVYFGANVNIASAEYGPLTITGVGTLAGNVTTTALTVEGTLDAATYNLVLSGSTNPFFINGGTFTASSSTVSYTNTGTVTTTATGYYNLTLGSGTYMLGGNTTSTNSFTNGGTLTIGSSYYLYAPGTFDNNGTITETGAIKHPLTSAKLTDSAGTEVTSYTASGDSVYVTVTDSDGNLSTSTVDTITGAVVTESTNSDSETMTLTETGADTGVFRSAANAFAIGNSASANSGVFNVNGDGTLTLAFTDSKESADTGSDTASFVARKYYASAGGAGLPFNNATLSSPTPASVVTVPAVAVIESSSNIAVNNEINNLVSSETKAPAYKFTKFLYLRYRGAEVRALQQKLKDLGYFTYPTITGYFGPVTKAAVVKFQKDNNLKPYPGWVGPATRRALNKFIN